MIGGTTRRRGLVGGDRLAVLAGLVVAAPALVFALLALAGSAGPLRDGLAASSVDLATDVGGTVRDAVERAVEAGIPFAELAGVEPFLATIVESEAGVAAIALVDGDGARLHAYGTPPADAPAGPARLALAGPDGAYGEVVVYPTFAAVRDAWADSLAFALGTVLALALAVGLFVRVVLVEAMELPALRLQAAAIAAGHGHFVQPPREPPGMPLAPLARALSAAVFDLERRLRDARVMVEEIRTIDFKSELSGRLAPVLATLSAYRTRRDAGRVRSAGWLGWWAIALLLAARAGDGLATGFAADRVGDDPLALAAIGAGLGVEAIGALLALAAMARVVPRPPLLAAILGAIAAAGAALLVFDTHDLWAFLLARAVAGFAAMTAVWALLSRPGAVSRRPFFPLLLIVAGVAAGPAVGALLAEVVGRRLAFLTMAIALSVLAFRFVLRLAGETGRPRLPVVVLCAERAIAVGGAVAGPVALLHVVAGGDALLAEHARLGLAFAVFGAGLALAAASGRRPPATVPLALMAALLAAAALAPAAPAEAVALPAGLLAGALYARAGSAAFAPSGLAVAALAMLVVGAAAAVAGVAGREATFLPIMVAILVAAAFASRAAAGMMTWRPRARPVAAPAEPGG